MDRKSTIIGLVLILGAFGMMFYSAREAQRHAEERREWEHRQMEERAAEPPEDTQPEGETPPPPELAWDSVPEAEREAPREEEDAPRLLRQADPAEPESPIVRDEPGEELYYLENDFIRVEFTSRGGAIRTVSLYDYPAEIDTYQPVVLNERHELPALSISLGGEHGVREFAPVYELVERSPYRIVFVREEIPGIELIREYEVSDKQEGPDPYTITHRTRIRNSTNNTFNIDRIWVNVGTAAPEAADRFGWNLNGGYFDGNSHDFFSARNFSARSGFLGIGRREARDHVEFQSRVVWASVKNQFFTSILTPSEPGRAIYLRPVDFPDPENDAVEQGISASVQFDLETVLPDDERTLAMSLYMGPKEYPRLSRLEQEQDRVMQFGIFGFISKILLHSLLGLQGIVGNWGVSIIVLTILIRFLFWPLTAKAARSSKKMAKIQEPLKKIREQYKDNPQKVQKETMKLFQQHKINPLAGCLPILIQIPIFIAFFYMLRSSSELRFASFLWIPDLSLPDTVASIAGFPINPLPVLMAATMYLQMRMMPTPSMDMTQQKILRLMPFVLLFVCYNFSSGLVLYWTMSNCFSIFQQFVTNRRKDPDEGVVIEAPQEEKAAPAPKPLKRKSTAASKARQTGKSKKQ